MKLCKSFFFTFCIPILVLFDGLESFLFDQICLDNFCYIFLRVESLGVVFILYNHFYLSIKVDVKYLCSIRTCSSHKIFHQSFSFSFYVVVIT